MRIGFIGAGKVATAFGRYLHIKGLPISGYFDRHPEKMSRAAHGTHSESFPDSNALANRSDIIFITTRDDQITGACHDLCRQNCIASRHLVGHMSGSHSSHILEEAQKQGAAVFSLHPLQAFADEEKALKELPSTYFSIEGIQAGIGPILDLLSRMGNPYFTLSAEHKSLYHLSACVLSNYLVTLMACGITALENAGIDPKEGFKAMRPLIDGTLTNIAQLGPARALTGPIARGDAGTIEQHLKALEHQGLDDIKSTYKFLGLKTLALASDETVQSDQGAEIRIMLEKK